MKVENLLTCLPSRRLRDAPNSVTSFSSLLGDGVKGAAPFRAFGFSELGMAGLHGSIDSPSGPGPLPTSPRDVEEKVATTIMNARDAFSVKRAPGARAERSLTPLPKNEPTPPKGLEPSLQTEANPSPSAARLATTPDLVPNHEAGRSVSWTSDSIVLSTLQSYGGRIQNALRQPSGWASVRNPQPLIIADGPMRSDSSEPADGARASKVAELLTRSLKALAVNASIAVTERDGKFTLVIGVAGLSSQDESRLQLHVTELANQLGLSISQVTINGSARPAPPYRSQWS